MQGNVARRVEPLKVQDLSSGNATADKPLANTFEVLAKSPSGHASDTSQPARNRVLCLPGRGPLDPLAATILLQLLGKHGFVSRTLPHDAASRAGIDRLEGDDIDIVCLLYLQIDGIPSHLRYLVRRLRMRLPHVHIIVGLWGAQDTDKWSADLQSAMGAECYASSLREVLAACRRIESANEEEALAVANA
ncbi:hypothetical protein GGD41_004105 [Paraburkholderia bryophila]|uniref:Response regulatory domain-containing protein n=1 Tax=Paraburkholderia bryophila TaxID=420952 RepID=A0A7Y9WA93_9BURK|nr:hypothetical protein [Paraburkholderia bryophila]